MMVAFVDLGCWLRLRA